MFFKNICILCALDKYICLALECQRKKYKVIVTILGSLKKLFVEKLKEGRILKNWRRSFPWSYMLFEQYI